MSKYDEQPVERDDSVATTDENVRDIAAGSTGGRAASPDERAAALCSGRRLNR